MLILGGLGTAPHPWIRWGLVIFQRNILTTWTACRRGDLAGWGGRSTRGGDSHAVMITFLHPNVTWNDGARFSHRSEFVVVSKLVHSGRG